MIATSLQRYATVVADPPWPIKWTSGRTTAGRSSGSTRTYMKRALPYSTLDVDAICALPIASMVGPDAHLFLWTLDRYALDGSAIRVMRAWGFEPWPREKPRMIVWHKANAGLGRDIRAAHELILIGRRGDARLKPASVCSVQRWKQPYVDGSKEHSAKPDAMIDMVESLSYGPYVELFARRARFGWDYYGDESLGTAIMPAVTRG